MNGMKKNVISMLLAVLFVCSLMTPAMAENAEAENSAQAVEQFSYEKRVLAALDIITDGDSAFEVEENVTRAQLTVAIARLYNLAGEAKGKSPFSDVKSSHWASGYITELYNMGMIVGTTAHSSRMTRLHCRRPQKWRWKPQDMAHGLSVREVIPQAICLKRPARDFWQDSTPTRKP